MYGIIKQDMNCLTIENPGTIRVGKKHPQIKARLAAWRGPGEKRQEIKVICFSQCLHELCGKL